MDWTLVIEGNREALKRILVTLANMASLGPHPGTHAAGEPRRTLPRHLYRFILRLLRPAEAAARRLVIVAARDVVVTLPPPRPRKPRPTSIFVRDGKGTGIVLPKGVRASDVLPGLARPRPARRSVALPLTDRLPKLPRWRPANRVVPRILAPGISTPHPVRRLPMPHDMIDATRLALRLQAVGRVLDDLPSHARRFARWRARSIAAAANPPLQSGGGGPHGSGLWPARGQAPGRSRHVASRFARIWPLRPGRPPGSRRRPTHEVHEILADLHHFAFHALKQRPYSS